MQFLSEALCKPRSLTVHDQKSINLAMIALLNFSWCPALIEACNVPDFLIRQIRLVPFVTSRCFHSVVHARASFKADTSSSIDILRDWASTELDLLRHLYRRGGDNMQAAIRVSYEACRHNQHTVTRMKLFRLVMKVVLSEGATGATETE